MRQVPDQMIAPTEVYSTDIEIQVVWPILENSATGNSDILSYNLYWDDGTGNTDVELVDDLVTLWTVTSLTGGLNYKFKVRAQNIYGYSAFSEEYIVEASDFPGKPPIPTVTLQTTNVHVQWVAPSSHFAVIDSYEILLMKADGSFTDDLTYCDGSANIIIQE